jgi:peptide/nickel transport system substrate-binding protein
MKRLRWLALVAVLALVAAACGGDAEPTETTAAPTETTAATTPPDTEPPSDTTAPPDTGGDGELASVAAESCDYGGKIQSVEATGTHEVVYTLCSPDPAFLAKLAFVPFAVQPAEHLEATGGAPLDNPIGTGPFMVDVWDRGSEIVMSRNPDYWGDAPAFDTLVFRWAAESTSRILELQSGNAHYITNLAASDYETIEGDDTLQLLEDPNPNIFYVGMTTSHAPFDDVRVRQAVAMGIDRQRIVDNFYPTGSEAASHFTPCTIDNGCEGEEWYEFDLEAPRRSSRTPASGRIRHHDPLPRRVPRLPAGAGRGGHRDRSQLQENLGINATVEVMESGAFIENPRWWPRRPPPAWLGCGLPARHQLPRLPLRCGPQFGDPIPELVGLLLQGATIVDPAEAAPVYEQANNLLKENVPMMPIAHGAPPTPPWWVCRTRWCRHSGPRSSPPWIRVRTRWCSSRTPSRSRCSAHDETDGESLSACQQVVEGSTATISMARWFRFWPSRATPTRTAPCGPAPSVRVSSSTTARTWTPTTSSPPGRGHRRRQPAPRGQHRWLRVLRLSLGWPDQRRGLTSRRGPPSRGVAGAHYGHPLSFPGPLGHLTEGGEMLGYIVRRTLLASRCCRHAAGRVLLLVRSRANPALPCWGNAPPPSRVNASTQQGPRPPVPVQLGIYASDVLGELRRLDPLLRPVSPSSSSDFR